MLIIFLLQFVGHLFTVFDLDRNGEIQMKEFISSLDRLEWLVPHNYNLYHHSVDSLIFYQFHQVIHKQALVTSYIRA